MKEISLTKGKVAIVDEEDYEWLSKYKWRFANGYAVRYGGLDKNKKQLNIRMHREIINAPDGEYVDHINGITLDNRKENLRIATSKQNSWNTRKRNNLTSKFKGVHVKEDGRYHVTITTNKSTKYVGNFTNEIAAANAYNHYAKEYFGEFAWLNNVPYMTKDEWESYKFKEVTSSKFKGVSWVKRSKRWEVLITVNGRSKHMGQFEDEIVAANYYNHLTNSKINQCEYISLLECEKLKYKNQTSSKYNGVSWKTENSKWMVNITHEKEKYFLGYFDSEKEAALAYNKKAIELNIKNIDKKLNIIEQGE